MEKNDSLIDNLLESKYAGNVTNYWPFKAEPEPDPASSVTLIPKPDQLGSRHSGTPSFLNPLLGTTLGLIAAIRIAFCILLAKAAQATKAATRLRLGGQYHIK